MRDLSDKMFKYCQKWYQKTLITANLKILIWFKYISSSTWLPMKKFWVGELPNKSIKNYPKEQNVTLEMTEKQIQAIKLVLSKLSKSAT